MPFTYKYVALFVPRLRAAEDFYRSVFDLELLFRESEQGDGSWKTLRAGLDWDDAEARGIEVGMVALRRDELVLALSRGKPAPGSVYELCVGLPVDEIATVRSRLPEGATPIELRPDFLRFVDPFGFRWAVQRDDAAFRSSGEIAGRWIE